MNKKTVLVTGATGGIGQTVCEHLLDNGFDLILSSRKKDRLESLQSKLERRYNKVVPIMALDFEKGLSEPQISKLLDDVGVIPYGLVLMTPRVEPGSDCLPSKVSWETMFNASFINILELVKSFVSKSNKNFSRKVVLISGISSAQVLSHYAMANVLRTVWLGQMKTLAFAYGSERINFNTVSLGGVLTNDYKKKILSRGQAKGKSYEEQLADETDNVPLKRYAEPQDVAACIEFFLSEGSNHLTGVNMMCDGGFTKCY